ncbi:MAG TPA: universal stress protein [Myxococcota bacterium]|nr:universal stress protein [Myxococcota bacterium]
MPEPFRILVASDGSPSSRAALDTTLAFPWPAASRARGVVALGGMGEGFGGAARAALVRNLHANVESLREALRRRWPEADAVALHEAPAEALLSEARRFRARVVALGWRGHGTFRRLLAGSVSRRMVARAPCSVLVARKASPSVRRLVVGFDGSPPSRSAIGLLEQLGPPRGNRLFLVQVLAPLLQPSLARVPAATRAAMREQVSRMETRRRRQAIRGLEAAAASLRAHGWRVSVQLRSGAPLAELLDAAKEHAADVLVLGAIGVSRMERVLLGSVAAGALDRSPVPVLIAR